MKVLSTRVEVAPAIDQPRKVSKASRGFVVLLALVRRGLDHVGMDSTSPARLDEPGVRALIARGEHGGVERKAEPPRQGLAPSIAAFANHEGGWLLVGVRDDGTICGYTHPGNGSAHDWLRDHLQHAVDPVPTFEITSVPTIEGPVLAIGIPPSPQAPHILKATGVVYTRVAGAKRPIDSQALLLELAIRPQEALRRAESRLVSPPLVHEALRTLMRGPQANGQTRVIDWHVAATPLGLPAAFAHRALQRDIVKETERTAVRALRRITATNHHLYMNVVPQGRGFVATGGHLPTKDEIALTVDSGGIAVARWSHRITRGPLELPAIGDRVLAPLLDLVAAALTLPGARGRAITHGYLNVTPTAAGWQPEIEVAAGGGIGTIDASEPVFLGGAFDLDTEHSTAHQAAAWERELGRISQLDTWEPASP